LYIFPFILKNKILLQLSHGEMCRKKTRRKKYKELKEEMKRPQKQIII